jgi:hypothetical protein
MNTRATHDGPTSPAHPRPAASPRRPSPWLLLLAIPFWLTVWTVNAPRQTCRCRSDRALSPPTSDLRYRHAVRTWSGPVPIPNAQGSYRLHMLMGDFPTHRRPRLVMAMPPVPGERVYY